MFHFFIKYYVENFKLDFVHILHFKNKYTAKEKQNNTCFFSCIYTGSLLWIASRSLNLLQLHWITLCKSDE